MSKFQLKRGDLNDLSSDFDEGDHYLAVTSNNEDETDIYPHLLVGPNEGGIPKPIKGSVENIWAGSIPGLDLSGPDDVFFGEPTGSGAIMLDGIRSFPSASDPIPQFRWEGSGDQKIYVDAPPIPHDRSTFTASVRGHGWMILDDQNDDTIPPIPLPFLPGNITVGASLGNYAVSPGTYDVSWRLAVDNLPAVT